MKVLLLGLIGLTLISCGKSETPEELFDFLDNRKKIDNLDNRLDTLEKRLNELYINLDSLNSSINDMNVNQDILEQSIYLNASNIATLESNNTVKEMIDPCGDNVGQFDEILLVMSDGSVIGYFEQGNKRFLTQLSNGNYRTTDKQACNFSIVNGTYQE